MVLTETDTQLKMDKFVQQNDCIAITIPASGDAHVWTQEGLDFSCYILYENGSLNYCHSQQQFTSESSPVKSRLVCFSGKSKFILSKTDETNVFFSKKAPIPQDFSCVLLVAMKLKFILIVADRNFSVHPMRFEFDVSHKNWQLCCSVLSGLIAQRSIASANLLRHWLNITKKHPGEK